MAVNIQAIRGMNDILPEHIPYWQYAEKIITAILSSYGYQEIRLPVLEKTELFKRTIGDVTDIVEKEMYTFDDRSGESLSLRPEATAGCIRAGIEHGLFFNQIRKLWCSGPMFRYERPQKGRYRQFYHIDVEAIGMEGPDIDAELILLGARLWKAFNIQDAISLEINSLGSTAARMHYREQLVHYFSQHYEKLDEDSQRRLGANPLRILDSKNPALASLIAGAPLLTEALDQESREHFDKLRQILDQSKIPYKVNPRLVRGLDYYNRTVFEWVTKTLGAQGTVCAGGRYDGLVEQLGGKSTPAVGFALGMDRLVLLLEAHHPVSKFTSTADLYLVMVGEEAKRLGLIYAEQLRDAFPGIVLLADCTSASFKNQFRRADQSHAKIALILGEEEVKQGRVTLKYLREEKPQETLSFKEALEKIQSYGNLSH